MHAIDVTVITDSEATVVGARDGDGLLVAIDDLPATTGWTRKPEGLCLGDVCVVVRDPASLERDGHVDLAVMAELIHRPLAIEPAAGVAVLGSSPVEVGDRLRRLEAPAFTLPDLSGAEVALRDFAGCKRLLVAFASW